MATVNFINFTGGAGAMRFMPVITAAMLGS